MEFVLLKREISGRTRRHVRDLSTARLFRVLGSWKVYFRPVLHNVIMRNEHLLLLEIRIELNSFCGGHIVMGDGRCYQKAFCFSEIQ